MPASMRDFWDRRAEEDPFYFVDSRMRYGDPDTEPFWEQGRHAVELIEQSLGVVAGQDDSVLEIGCGVGRMTRALAELGADVRAVDVSPRMLEIAERENAHLANVEWILGDGRSLARIEDGSVDACYSFVVFQHIPDPAITLGYIREIGRVLRPGGWVALQISDDPDIHARRPLLERLGRKLKAAAGRGPRGQDDPAWRGSAVSVARLGETARAAGMDVERVVGAGSQYCLVLLRRPV